MPDLATEEEPLDRLAVLPTPVEVGDGTGVLVVVGLAGPEP